MANVLKSLGMLPRLSPTKSASESENWDAMGPRRSTSRPWVSKDGPLTRLDVASYAVGTWLNDACAACWFSYLLIYLERVHFLTGLDSGLVLLVGQAADAVSTPILGLLSDRSKGLPALGLGRRHAFYLLGTSIVMFTFLFVFGICVPCLAAPGGRASLSNSVLSASFSVGAGLFNIGWSAAQVSHVALVLELTHVGAERITLNSARYAVTILANLFVFTVMFLLLNGARGDAASGEDNPSTYLSLTLAVLVSGLVFAMIFLAMRRTPIADEAGGATAPSSPEQRACMASPMSSPELRQCDPPDAAAADGVSGKRPTPLLLPPPVAAAAVPGVVFTPSRTPADWMRNANFYKTTAMYTLMRLGITVQSVYLPFFVNETLAMDQVAIAIIPLITYISSLIIAATLKMMSAAMGVRQTLALGGCVFVVGCVLTATMPPTHSWILYPAAALLGAGGAAVTVSVHNLQGDLIGSDIKSSAFVLGGMSFADKITTGVMIVGLQAASDTVTAESRGEYFRYVESLVPMCSIVLCILAMGLIPAPDQATTTSPPDGGDGTIFNLSGGGGDVLGDAAYTFVDMPQSLMAVAARPPQQQQQHSDSNINGTSAAMSTTNVLAGLGGASTAACASERPSLLTRSTSSISPAVLNQFNQHKLATTQRSLRIQMLAAAPACKR